MSQITSADHASRMAEVLVRHPGVADARVVQGPDGRFCAYVVPVPGCGRVAAEGRCALIDPAGGSSEGELLDISLAGVRVRVSAVPALSIGADVQLWIESPALGGGIDGWLGRVRWMRNGELGIAFAGNFDEGLPLVRMVQAFSDAGGRPVPAAPRIDDQTRASVECRAVLRVGTLELSGRTVDLSAGGVGFQADEAVHLDLRSRDVRIQLDADGLTASSISGTVVRQDGDFVGIELRANAADAAALRALVEASVTGAGVSTAALTAWLEGRGMSGGVEVRFVDELPQVD